MGVGVSLGENKLHCIFWFFYSRLCESSLIEHFLASIPSEETRDTETHRNSNSTELQS